MDDGAYDDFSDDAGMHHEVCTHSLQCMILHFSCWHAEHANNHPKLLIALRPGVMRISARFRVDIDVQYVALELIQSPQIRCMTLPAVDNRRHCFY